MCRRYSHGWFKNIYRLLIGGLLLAFLVWAHEDSIIGRGSFVGDAAVDSGAAGGYVAVVDAVIDIPGNIGTIWDYYTDDDDDDDDWCYITTAVMNSEGHDNSPELKSMRHLLQKTHDLLWNLREPNLCQQ